MFGNKKKQQKASKKQKSSTKNTTTNQYFQKIKDKCFQIYLNAGIKQHQSMNDQDYTSMVSINQMSQFSQNLIKNFSSIYQMDSKSFQWKNKVDELIKNGRDVLKIIDKFKNQVVEFNQRKKDSDLKKDQNTALRQEIESLRSKLSQKTLIETEECYKNSIKKQFTEQLSEKQSISLIKVLEQKDIQILQLRAQLDILRIENTQLRIKNHNLLSKYQQKQRFLQKIRQSSFDQRLISTINQVKKQQIHQDIKTCNQQQQQISFEKQILCNFQISQILVSFLPPRSICSLLSLSKSSRFFLYKSRLIMLSTFESIVNFKNYQIKFFHRHIEHFQTLSKKIPDQILQLAYYQYNILKQSIGGDFISILNLCGKIFQGKFGLVVQQGKTIKQYVQSKDIIHFVQIPKDQQVYLRIQKQLVKQFFQQRKTNKLTIMKQIQIMNTKIGTTQSLYSFDQKTLKQFYQTVIRNFTILFVLSKHLFAQARNLQHLNIFLLGQLNEIDKFKMEKQYDLQDVKTQVMSYKKTVQFLNEKCKSAQERILWQNKEQLQLQKNMTQLQQKINYEQQKINILTNELLNKNKQTEKLKQRNNQIKTLYNNGKQRYNLLLNQLALVKQTISKIN